MWVYQRSTSGYNLTKPLHMPPNSSRAVSKIRDIQEEYCKKITNYGKKGPKRVPLPENSVTQGIMVSLNRLVRLGTL